MLPCKIFISLHFYTIFEHWCSHDVDTLPQIEIHMYAPSYQPLMIMI